MECKDKVIKIIDKLQGEYFYTLNQIEATSQQKTIAWYETTKAIRVLEVVKRLINKEV